MIMELSNGRAVEGFAQRTKKQGNWNAQLHLWDSKLRTITQVGELGTCFFGPSYTKIPFNTNDLQ